MTAMQNGLAIWDVCSALGLDSVSAFTGLFKRRVGMSPSYYQKVQKKRKKDISDHPLRIVPNCFAESNGWTKHSNFQETS